MNAFANVFKAPAKTPVRKAEKVAKAMVLRKIVKKDERVSQVGSVAEAMGLTRCN